ncbi:MAG: aminotransferase class IV [Chitinophagaceae bacterium]
MAFLFMEEFVCFNGDMISKGQAILTADNRGFKYGDGVFETIKWKNDRIILGEYHFDRLFNSLKLIQINADSISSELFEKSISDLCIRNKSNDLARVRLAVYRGKNNKALYLIEAQSLEKEVADWNEKGWTIDLHPYVRKTCDVYANLKTANYLPYVMAELYKQERELDECLILNSSNNICDGSISNIFILNNKVIFTPALSQGCINGVIRRFVIEELKKHNYVLKQGVISVDMLLQADEVFLTNAIRGVKWVKSFREKEYDCTETRNIYNILIKGFGQ